VNPFKSSPFLLDTHYEEGTRESIHTPGESGENAPLMESKNRFVQSSFNPSPRNMGISFSSLLSHYFGTSEVRILMVRKA
jgi:hypothetical protein